MNVNELIKILSEKVKNDPSYGQYIVKMNSEYGVKAIESDDLIFGHLDNGGFMIELFSNIDDWLDECGYDSTFLDSCEFNNDYEKSLYLI